MNSRTTSALTSSAFATWACESVTQPRSVRLAEATAGQLRKVLPTPVLRLAFRAGYQTMSVWWFITRPAASGAKVVVTRGDEILFIRHTYGERDVWDLPGGTAADGESPPRTAARELSEETGLSGELQPLGTWTGDGRGRHGQLHGFRVEVDQQAELTLDAAEIAQARWFEIDDLPGAIARGSEALVGAALRRRVNA